MLVEVVCSGLEADLEEFRCEVCAVGDTCCGLGDECKARRTLWPFTNHAVRS